MAKLALPFAAHAYKARDSVHRPAGSHAHQKHSTHYDSDGSESDSTSGMRPVSVLSNLNIRRRDINGAIPFFDTKSGLKFGRAAHTQIKIHLHRPPLQLVHPPLRLKMGKSTGKGAMALSLIHI